MYAYCYDCAKTAGSELPTEGIGLWTISNSRYLASISDMVFLMSRYKSPWSL